MKIKCLKKYQLYSTVFSFLFYFQQSAANYRGYRISRDTLAVRLSESLLRTAKLEETLTEGATLHSSSEVIIQLARDCINVDSTLGLAYLLALPEVSSGGTITWKLVFN